MNPQNLQFESPIEERLAIALLPQLHESIELESQVQVKAACNYRVDFMIIAHNRTIVIECDGREYHDFATDQVRDIDLLKFGGIDEVYRFRGIDINHNPETCANEIIKFAPYLQDPLAEPLTLEGAYIAASSFPGRNDKPIIRKKATIDQLTPKTWSVLRGASTFAVLDAEASPATIIVQFKTPFWDWANPEAKAWPLGGFIEGAFNELI